MTSAPSISSRVKEGASTLMRPSLTPMQYDLESVSEPVMADP